MKAEAEQEFYVSCPRGLEAVLADELHELGYPNARASNAGVEVSGPFWLAYRVNLSSRVASRVLWRVAHGEYSSENDLYAAALALPWDDWFEVGRTIAVKIDAQKSPLRSIDFATLKIKDAVCDKFRSQVGKRPDVSTHEPDVRIYAFLTAREYSLYLDTSGQPLFQRGYRRASGEAPLRENLAAGILRLAEWDPGEALLDPMCGSGTFVIEAALRALNIAPGIQREFAFENLRNFDSARWQSMRDAARNAELPRMPLAIYGSDLYGSALKTAQENVTAAGLDEVIDLNQANILEISAPAPSGVLVTNPPYGVRIGESAELEQFYPALGDVLKKHFSDWRAYILSADMNLPKLIRLQASRRTPLFNGALECRLFEYKIVAGSMRK